MFFLGIDPGHKGALVLLSNFGEVVQMWDMPTREISKNGKSAKQLDCHTCCDYLAPYCSSIAHVAIEDVHASRGMGCVSAFTFGYAAGSMAMMVAALRLPYTLVKPESWKRVMLPGMSHQKDGSMLRAKQLWPTQQFHGSKGGEKDGRAEAALMAMWAIKQTGLAVRMFDE